MQVFGKQRLFSTAAALPQISLSVRLAQLPVPVGTRRIALLSRQLDDGLTLLAAIGKRPDDEALAVFFDNDDADGCFGHRRPTMERRCGSWQHLAMTERGKNDR